MLRWPRRACSPVRIRNVATRFPTTGRGGPSVLVERSARETMTGRSERSARSALGFAGRRLVVVVAVAVVLGALIALALAERQPARYAASAEVAVNQQAGLGSAGANSAQGLQRQIETLASVAHSPLVAAPAAATHHDSGWDGTRLLDDSTVEPSANADVLVFHVDAP